MTITLPSVRHRALPSDQDATGRTLGDEEIAAVTAALQSGVLTSTKGSFVKDLESRFAAMMGVKHAFACSSGTAAIHCAVAAIDPDPGDEIITTSITDMGALTPLLYQGAIPVFADVDPATCNVTAATIAEKLSDRTKAIIVTHLFGNPCEIDEIVALGNRVGVPVIEDCAQAFLAGYRGNFVGTVGQIGCFSLQQGKHVTSGEGGLVVTNDDELARRMFLFINKAWGYGDPRPDHYFIALNYRMSEITGAVAGTQLAKLPTVVARRRMLAEVLTAKLRGVRGIAAPRVLPGAQHSYWKYALRTTNVLDGEAVVEIGRYLGERGIASAPRYIQKPAFRCAIFEQRRTFGKSGFPFGLARPSVLDYSAERYPGTFAALERVLVVPWNERYDEKDVEYIADAIASAVDTLTCEKVAS